MVRNVLFGCAAIAALAMSAGAQDVNVPGDFATIQEGIDNVGPGGTVFVGPGIYTESLVIDPTGLLGPARGQSSMTIEATAPGVVIQWAAGAHVLPAAAISVNGLTLDYVLLAQSVSSLSLVDLEFAGLDDVTSGMLSCGIVLVDTNALVDGCFLHNFQESPTGTDNNGIGIRVEGIVSDVDIIDSTITTTQTAYISAVANCTVDVLTCQLIGRGPTGSLPQLGVSYGGAGTEIGAGGVVDNNFISGFWFTGGAVQGAGVQNNSGGTLVVTNNEFQDCQVGVHDLNNTVAINTTIDRNVFTQLVSYTTGVVPMGVLASDGDPSNVLVIKDNRFNNHEGPGVYLLTDGASVTNNFFNNNGPGFGNANCQDDGLPGGNSWVGNSYTDFRINSGWPTYFQIPGSAGAKDWDAMGVGEAMIFGYHNEPGSILAMGGRPGIGTTFTVGVDNPTGTMTAGLVVYLFSFVADPAYPNGTVFPGYGMDGGDGELLVDLTNSLSSGLNQFLVGWTDAGGPLPLPIPIPDEPALVGTTLFLQGVIMEPGSPASFGMSRGIQMTLGY